MVSNYKSHPLLNHTIYIQAFERLPERWSSSKLSFERVFLIDNGKVIEFTSDEQP